MSKIRNSIGELISDIAQKNSDRDALVHTEAGQRHSYQDFSHEIDRAARGFLSRGIRPGDKIALWSDNVPQWLVAFLALAKIGAITVPIDPAAAKDNLYYILEQSESRGLIVAGRTDSGNMIAAASAAKNDIPLLEHIIVITGSSDTDLISWNELIAAGDNTTLDTLAKISGAINPEDPVAIMYTSGTTGQPKGAKRWECSTMGTPRQRKVARRSMI